MRVVLQLSALTLQQALPLLCESLGVKLGEPGDLLVGWLRDRLSDASQKLPAALQRARERAWQALEIGLAGDSFLERCRRLMAGGDERAFRQQVQAFLSAHAALLPRDRDDFARACLSELRTARKRSWFSARPTADDLARRAGDLVRFDDPQRLIETEKAAVAEIADALREGGFANLCALLTLPPGPPLLVVAARYFLRREIEKDAELFRGITTAKLERLGQEQETGFAALDAALAAHGDKLDELLTVTLDVYEIVLDLQRQFGLLRRELHPSDSMLIRATGDRQRVREAAERYRAVSPSGRDYPAVLHEIGKLHFASGDFSTAQADCERAAALLPTATEQAEAYHDAFRGALERRLWGEASQQIERAVALDAARFAPFPLDRYEMRRVLGAGGFGVVFLCRHRFLNADVVVKSLFTDDLDRGIEEVFAEAHALMQVSHEAVIRVLDCGLVDGAARKRPYLVMEYFDGKTLEDHVREKGSVSAEELPALARPIAEALRAAHGRNVLHRDVKPGNVLVRRDAKGWSVKLIDFGLAVRRQAVQASLSDPTTSRRTIVGESIAGTLDYAAPEQMGKLAGVGTTPASDAYGFARTCCYALFGTAQPTPKDFRRLPEGLADLLSDCLEENPRRRPAEFGAVLARLEARGARQTAPQTRPVEIPAPRASEPEKAIAVNRPVAKPVEVRREEPANAARLQAGEREIQRRRDELVKAAGTPALASSCLGCFFAAFVLCAVGGGGGVLIGVVAYHLRNPNNRDVEGRNIDSLNRTEKTDAGTIAGLFGGLGLTLLLLLAKIKTARAACPTPPELAGLIDDASRHYPEVAVRPSGIFSKDVEAVWDVVRYIDDRLLTRQVTVLLRGPGSGWSSATGKVMVNGRMVAEIKLSEGMKADVELVPGWHFLAIHWSDQRVSIPGLFECPQPGRYEVHLPRLTGPAPAAKTTFLR